MYSPIIINNYKLNFSLVQQPNKVWSTFQWNLLLKQTMKFSISDNSYPHCCCWSWSLWRSSVWDHHHLCFGLHSLCNRSWPQEGCNRHNCPHCHWFHCWGQHLGCRPLLRRVYEPRSIIWTRRCQRRLHRQLDLLGWTPHWWWDCWPYLWQRLHSLWAPTLGQ